MGLKFCYLHLTVTFVLIISFWTAAEASYRENIYDIYEVEDNCGYVYKLGSNSTSSLKLAAFNKTSDTKKTVYCNFTIQPPADHGIIIHFEHFKLDDAVKNICHFAYLEITNNDANQSKVCGTKPEGSSIYFEEEANFYFFAEQFVTHKNFILVATAFQKVCDYTPSNFRCTNGKCIWEGLVKDGVNNCGDNSDETSVKDDCDEVDDPFAIIIPYVAMAIVLLVLGVVIFTFIRKRYSASTIPPVRMSDIKIDPSSS